MSEARIQALSEAYNQLKEAVEGLSPQQLAWKQSPEVWSVKEVLTHLADHLIVVSFRIRDILAGTGKTLPVFSQDSWITGQHANEGETEDVFEAYGALLRYNARLLQRLTPQDWEKKGINAKGEEVSITEIVRLFAAHVQNHLGQIGRMKQALAAAAV
ncbi:DinB family protein [Paenibacillus pinistramenti]|uniref:DinB family protein n=1 Tax=Paenibacillus pinistramenti TaxID=1768003 RepID=UPI0011095C0F|nr:DinB family protein [Paenibacillus pinistramenti]